MVRATDEDGIPLPAIVWVHYNIMENEDMSGWIASIICPKDQLTPSAQAIVSSVVSEYGWCAQELTASAQSAPSSSEQQHMARHVPTGSLDRLWHR